ncbi:hypothetical protein HMPREF9151_02585 [Hoylesella saccharolytica F0055]|jgi:hypothetical protein|uniref:Uncharacterized protein n=1 Tax=Hoylesella saccharolytica F0055 TaxID=1127699 RepID=L1MXT1_9BACT|nr:hypothetical protein HMPREF9151_02585 [Hoylesella saccharolytica F0055]
MMNNQYKTLITSCLYSHHLLIMDILLMKKEKDIFSFRQHYLFDE